MMALENVFILSASRTPVGSYGGILATIPATQLGATAIRSAVDKAGISSQTIESVVMGNVLSANLGQAPARQAALFSGLPQSVCATTVNKICASGMKAVSMIYQSIRLADLAVGVGGGMESMSQVPHYLPSARFGTGYGNAQLIDGLAKDGLVDVYNQTAMGVSGDKTAERYGLSRESQDDFAEQSYRRSADAWAKGYFQKEVVPIEVPQKKGPSLLVQEDEAYKKANFEKMRTLKPAFSLDGTVTAANASPMNDGAAALVLASGTYVTDHQLTPVARIVGYAEAEQDPLFFTTTPVLATQKVLQKAGLTLADIDFFEVNEAFAVVPLAYMQLLNVPLHKVNVFGGAVALGHPLGASGARILTTLLTILAINKGRYGLAAICNGGGGASAMIIERTA